MTARALVLITSIIEFLAGAIFFIQPQLIFPPEILDDGGQSVV